MNIIITRHAWNHYRATLTFDNPGMNTISFNARTAYEATKGAAAHIQRLEEGAGIPWQMKTIEINKTQFKVELKRPEHYGDTGSWRNGIITLPNGRRICGGGGWIENASSANEKNECAGIAGGMRQGVWYPNEISAGDYTPYQIGEDESYWEKEVMPAIYGDDWQDREDTDDELEETYTMIQNALTFLERASRPA